MFSLFDSPANLIAPANSQWNVSLPGFDNTKASQTYGQCILAGGNDNECASKGFNAGSGGSAQITSQGSSILDKAKYALLGALGVASGNPQLALGAAKAEASANGISSLTVSRIATGLVGLILVAGAMFLFGVANFTPEGEILKAVKGATN